jgi:hypothetical protein
VKSFYRSYSYIDDLAWAAAWLATRTGAQEDIDNARFYLQQHISEEAGGDRRRYAHNVYALLWGVHGTSHVTPTWAQLVPHVLFIARSWHVVHDKA